MDEERREGRDSGVVVNKELREERISRGNEGRSWVIRMNEGKGRVRNKGSAGR